MGKTVDTNIDAKFVITIARQYCAGGRKVGKLLAEELGIDCYDSEMFRLVSDNKNMETDVIAHDARIKDTLLYDVAREVYEEPLPNPEVDDILVDKLADSVSMRNLYDYQSHIITELANRESCIIIGRCANYILKDRPNVLNVFIHAPIGFRLKRAASIHYMDQMELRNYLAKVDERKADYYLNYTGTEWMDISNYDLSIDTGKLGIRGAVELIERYINNCM